jgi:hypothetical protein
MRNQSVVLMVSRIIAASLIVASVIFELAQAQPLFTSKRSLEIEVANAEQIYLGKIRSIGLADAKTNLLPVTLDVTETLKGQHQAAIDCRLIRFMFKSANDSVVGHTLLLAIDRRGESVQFIGWDLSEQGWLECVTANLHFPDSASSILDHVRQMVRQYPGGGELESFRRPIPAHLIKKFRPGWYSYYETGGRVDLDVPIDCHLESWAQQVLRSSADNRDLLESHYAIEALRYFHTPENLAILRNLDCTNATTLETVQKTLDYWGD